MTTVAFIALPSDLSLRKDIRQLMDNLAAGARESQKPLAARALETAAREILQATVTNLVKQLEDPARPAHDIHKTLRSIDTHIGSLTRVLVGVLSNAKIEAAMRHYQTMLIDIDDENGVPQPWMGFRVDDAFVTELRAVQAHLRDSSAPYDSARTVRLLNRVTDMVVRQFAEIPKEEMEFGFLMRKTADGGIALIRSAMHGMIGRSIPHLNTRQRAGLAEHIGSFVIELPADRYA